MLVLSLFISGCFQSNNTSKSQAEEKKEVITVKEYHCRKCGMKVVTNGKEFEQREARQNADKFISVIKKVDFEGVILNPRIETSRLLLRELTMDDLDAFFTWAQNPEVTQTTVWKPHKTKAKSRKILQGFIDKYNRGEIGPWGIVRKDTGQLIGTILAVEWYPVPKRMTIGYTLSSEHWGHGFTTEAARALVEFIFTHYDINRVEAYTTPDNIASQKVLSKAGMSYEGTFRDWHYYRGKYYDISYFSVLRNEMIGKIKFPAEIQKLVTNRKEQDGIPLGHNQS